MAPPIAKAIAVNWNGGTLPLAAVIRARRDHIRMAENPTAVAKRRWPDTENLPDKPAAGRP
jgi:hypothetical protein